MRSLLTLAAVTLIGTISVAAEKAAIPDLPDAFSSFGACVLDNHVYVYGGHAGKTHSYSTETTLGKLRRLNLADTAKGWEELAGGLHLQGVALVAHNGKVIRVGGMEPRNKPGDPADNHSTASVQSYDPKANKWTDLAPLPAGRSSHDAVVVGDTLYVFGGWNMKGKDKPDWHDTFLALDLSGSKAEWKSAPQPFVRRALTAAAVGGKVYVLGGLTAKGDSEVKADVLDVATGKWSSGPAFPEGKMNGFTPASVVAGGQLYLSTADGLVYKLDGDKWTEAGKLATPRWVHRAVPLGADKFLAIGGAAKGGSRADGEVIAVK